MIVDFSKLFLILITLELISPAFSFVESTKDTPKICNYDGETISIASEELSDNKKIAEFLINDFTVFETLNQSVSAKLTITNPKKNLNTSKDIKFPSFSNCAKPFFRVATIEKKIDRLISTNGWLSGDARGVMGTGLSSEHPVEERIIQYVGIKGGYNGVVEFPKNSTIIGVLEDPIRALSVGYHTGWTSDPNKYMRLDEIELGECAQNKECQKIKPINTTQIFETDKEKRLEKKLPIRIARYSVEGEWAVENKIPNSCIVATYRIKRQKVDKIKYSGSY